MSVGDMMKLDDMEKLIQSLVSMLKHNKFDKYITNITFPNFKNIKPNSSLDFDFPLTALVGANGSGKSSILHALWGAPKNFSTSRFWFSTDLDPINEGGDEGINRYYYTYWENKLHMHLQAVKLRGKKRQGYWEPGRVRPRDGMTRMPEFQKEHALFRSADRWNPVERKVVYINFKCEFSAFDKYFYFADNDSNLEDRQKKFTLNSSRLKRIIDEKMTSMVLYKHERIVENRELTNEELFWIRHILGHNYIKASYIKHSLYDNNGSPSVLFSKPSINYSEAFAGSGELAVVRAVIELLKAENNSLVLLDEPETSLHPQAQINLLQMLLTLIKEKQLQVILSTHSPIIVDALPTSAIKILEETDGSKVSVIDCRHPQMAFKRLGFNQAQGKIILAVEDQLLSEILRAAIHKLDPGERDIFEIFVPPGGADTILAHHISTWIFEDREIFVFLDGDKAPNTDFKWEEVKYDDAAELKAKTKSLVGCLPFNPSLDEEEFFRDYLMFIKNRTFYLDEICPELVWLNIIDGDNAKNNELTNQDSKKALVAYYTQMNFPTAASDLACYFRVALAEATSSNSSIEHFHSILKKIIKCNSA